MHSLRPRRVVFAVRYMNHYRENFYRGLGDVLADHGVEFEMVHGDPSPSEATKRDSVTPSWSTRIPNRVIAVGNREVVWQPLFRHLRSADLVIVEQASRLILNYILLANRLLGRPPRVALIGHGTNRASDPHRVGEAVKARLTSHVDWFFAYTEGSREQLESAGFPGARITVFQNTIDTDQLRAELASITNNDIQSFRASLGVGGDEPLVLTLGSLYPDKRPATAIETVARMRDRIGVGHLLLVGSGELDAEISAAAHDATWLTHHAARFGREKALALASSDVLLIPGVAGLVVIDGLAAGLPIVTAQNPHHPPEIDYVEHGVHGIIAGDATVESLGDALTGLVTNPTAVSMMAAAARQRGSELTVSHMIDRFAGGVLDALACGAEPTDQD